MPRGRAWALMPGPPAGPMSGGPPPGPGAPPAGARAPPGAASPPAGAGPGCALLAMASISAVAESRSGDAAPRQTTRQPGATPVPRPGPRAGRPVSSGLASSALASSAATFWAAAGAGDDAGCGQGRRAVHREAAATSPSAPGSGTSPPPHPETIASAPNTPRHANHVLNGFMVCLSYSRCESDLRGTPSRPGPEGWSTTHTPHREVFIPIMAMAPCSLEGGDAAIAAPGPPRAASKDHSM